METTAMPLHLEPGAIPVPGYTLVRPLGRGGFGEVWEATAPGGVRVALKFLRIGTPHADVEERALGVIRDIRHPHLLDVQFAARVEDCLVIAMPLCDQSLADRLRACQQEGEPGIPRNELLGYIEDLARAIDFLNESQPGVREGVQHRDIKPHNIFLSGGSVRLADFGLAKVLEGTLDSHTGCMSPHYVAPEVVDGKVSRWSDQYALAVSYVELRTGRRPITGASISQLLYAHVHQPPDLSGLPESERAPVARALAKPAEARWPSCREFVRALEAEAVSEDATTAPAYRGARREGPGATATVPEPARDRWALIGGVVAAVALAGLVLFLVSKRGPAPSEERPATPIPRVAAREDVNEPPVTKMPTRAQVELPSIPRPPELKAEAAPKPAEPIAAEKLAKPAPPPQPRNEPALSPVSVATATAPEPPNPALAAQARTVLKT
jgi:serine/threonine-protein kinase